MENRSIPYMVGVMEAFKSGEEIECASRKVPTIYTQTDFPSWNWANYDYRIKPKPKKLWKVSWKTQSGRDWERHYIIKEELDRDLLRLRNSNLVNYIHIEEFEEVIKDESN